MKNPFKNQQGQVRWGYKFFSLILIWDMVIPVIILAAALAFSLALRILLMNMGIMDGDGSLMEEYMVQADNWYMVIMMCIQNLVVIFLPFALWKWVYHSSWKNLGIHGKGWLKDLGKGLLLGAVMITLVAAGICLTGNASMSFGKTGFDPWLIGYLVMFMARAFPWITKAGCRPGCLWWMFPKRNILFLSMGHLIMSRKTAAWRNR